MNKKLKRTTMNNAGVSTPLLLLKVTLILSIVVVIALSVSKLGEKKQAPGRHENEIVVMAKDVSPLSENVVASSKQAINKVNQTALREIKKVSKLKEEQEALKAAETTKLKEEAARQQVEAQTQDERQVQSEQPLIESSEVTQVNAAAKINPPQNQPYQLQINGTSMPYKELGPIVNTELVQQEIDKGLIVSQLTNFNPNDGQTTYFGGHNPGIMRHMEENMAYGSHITVTDKNGLPTVYVAVDHAIVDIYGENALSSLNMSVIDVYSYGSNEESIIIQYCQTSGGLMNMWYLIPA